MTISIYSGNCRLCDIGRPTGATDCNEKELHTGDIVIIYSVRYIGTDNERWELCAGLTAVVANQYQSYSNGHVAILDNDAQPFVMGIKDCKFNHPEWRIELMKKFSDVVDGEHWPQYGFSYKEAAVLKEQQ